MVHNNYCMTGSIWQPKQRKSVLGSSAKAVWLQIGP